MGTRGEAECLTVYDCQVEMAALHNVCQIHPALIEIRFRERKDERGFLSDGG